jgi:MFS family permease
MYTVLLISSFAYNFSFILLDYVRPFLVRDIGLTLADTALLYTAQSAGVICGSFLMPILASRWGSRILVVLSAAGVSLLTLACLHALRFWPWALARFGVGIMLAGCYVSATTMLANFLKPRVRGRLMAVNGAMFSLALLAAGAVGALSGQMGWRLLLWLAVIASALVAGLGVWFLPDDRRAAVYADEDAPTAISDRAGRWRDMWTRHRRRLTATCLVLAGLNFCGYEFYSGFITTYLLDVRHFSVATTGWFVTLDGFGMFAGNVLWGWFADRHGRRLNAVIFGGAAIFIALVLVAPRNTLLLATIELGYALCLSATSCWPAYFAELFPIRLRPMGTALFHGGHVISLFAPLIVAMITQSYSLVIGMALAPLTFLVAALLWWTLPETLRTCRAYRGFVAEAGEASAR